METLIYITGKGTLYDFVPILLTLSGIFGLGYYIYLSKGKPPVKSVPFLKYGIYFYGYIFYLFNG